MNIGVRRRKGHGKKNGQPTGLARLAAEVLECSCGLGLQDELLLAIPLQLLSGVQEE